ncbi:cyclic nucleotide-binding domain-containing protein [Lutimaribacter pacificus]|uniref:cyclic nucleotide-binding domain-containing protein n=1 Tax=Lutimaribacter pacificus TaxID=391948 RepID=UPI00122CC928|nr:cyclic nucleotide-binding domain-containing protein [Lutimaribacter pacificus]
MFGKKKISDPPPPVENDQLSTEVLDKHRQIICRSELVANEDDLAAKIIGMSRLVKFDKGQVLMTHGEDADDVYFILFGSVRVSINSTFIDTREAPQTIGEMAAMKPGAARSADVYVESEKLEARVISAHDFRTLMSTHTEFSTRLSSMVDSMNRKNIRLLGTSSRSPGNAWTWTSIVFGAVVGLLCGIWLGLGGSPLWFAILSALGAGALSTLVAIRMNPDLIYRNMFWLSGAAMIAQTVQTVFSLSFSVDGTQNQLPLLWNFNSNPEQKWWVVLIIYLSLAALAFMSWLADRDLRRNSSKSE